MPNAANALELFPAFAPAFASKDLSLFVRPLRVVKKQATQSPALWVRAVRVKEVLDVVTRAVACFKRQHPAEIRLTEKNCEHHKAKFEQRQVQRTGHVDSSRAAYADRNFVTMPSLSRSE